MNSTSFQEDLAPLECPVFTKQSEELLNDFSFWVEGVLCCVIAVLGFLGNIGSAFVLSSKDMRNSFNLLLIVLSCFDNVYLMGGILEAIRRDFGLATKSHIILFPYFLYPVQSIAMTGSILLTVTIALERYVAVHYPINYSQSSNAGGALRTRMAKYLTPVALCSILFNVTKFFEATIDYSPDEDMPSLIPTKLRTNPDYSIYFNWFRFIAIGIVPFGLLVFFNAQIYRALHQRRKRAGFWRNQSLAASCNHSVAALSDAGNGSNESQANVKEDSAEEIYRNNLLRRVSQKAVPTDKTATTNQEDGSQETIIMSTPNINSTHEHARLLRHQDSGQSVVTFHMGTKISSSDDPKGTTMRSSIKLQRLQDQVDPSTPPLEKSQKRDSNGDGLRAGLLKVEKTFYNSSIRRYRGSKGHDATRDKNQVTTGDYEASTGTPVRNLTKPSEEVISTREVAKANARRRKMEDHLASIFMGYILVFLICHSPRLVLNIYELITIRNAVLCRSSGFQPFPQWSLVLTCMSHLLLIANSSINILIYCALSSKFREEVTKLFKSLCRKT